MIEKRSKQGGMLLLRLKLALHLRKLHNLFLYAMSCRQKKFEVGRECRKLSKEIRHKENPTDADYNKVIDECLDVEIKEAQLEKEYFERFKKILSPEKVYKYRNAEYKFVRNFMKSGRDNKKEEKQKK